MMNVSFLYTDVNKYPSSSYVLATFSIHWKIRRFLRLSIKVTREDVQLLSRCLSPQKVSVIRDPMELMFDSASTLYIGQAGPLIKSPFDVSTYTHIIVLNTVFLDGRMLCFHMPNNYRLPYTLLLYTTVSHLPLIYFYFFFK